MKFNFVVRLLALISLSSQAAFAGVKLNELVPGDLVFSMNALGGADHVGMFAGIGEDGRPYVVHAVSEKYKAVVRTILKPIDTSYVVFRNHNLSLALSASRRIGGWAKLKIPYDFDAANLALDAEDYSGFRGDAKQRLEQYYEYAKSQSIPRFYRRIKYAARRNMPILPSNEQLGSSGRGFRCDEVVILSYQVEEIADFVRSIGSPDGESLEFYQWISDKYAMLDILDQCKATPEYRAYQNSLLEKDEYLVVQRGKRNDPKHIRFLPSICAWREDLHPSVEKFAESFDTVLPIDSKVSSPSVLLTHVSRDSLHWASLGPVRVESSPVTEEEKEQWRNFIAQLFRDADEKQNRAAERIISSAREFAVSPLLGIPPTSPRTSPSHELGDQQRQMRRDIHGTPPRLSAADRRVESPRLESLDLPIPGSRPRLRTFGSPCLTGLRSLSGSLESELRELNLNEAELGDSERSSFRLGLPPSN